MTDNNITALPVERKFPIEAELTGRINELIHEYDGQVSTVSVIGVLELVKRGVIDTAINNT